MRIFGIRVPASCVVLGAPNITHMNGKLLLGERVLLSSEGMNYSFGHAFPRCFLSSSAGASVEIGDDTEVNLSAIYASTSIRIGKRVLIAADCRIIDHDGHDVDRYPRPHKENLDGEPIVIEDDVWLCADVTVCKGVTIGKGSVIGTKSVVTHDIPPGVLAAGVPARVIRPLRLGDR